MLNPERQLPRRIPLIGPPVAVAVDFPADVVERFADALREWDTTEQSRTDHRDQEV
ncbi:hypothetical protein [Nocardia vinacea]|uniref:hypothetical protein n=1 Tax=Nocardia vinacea TaxID=96468 RepID=UPI0002D79508|nr:hypothetical protein [Nocardia vinacea]